MSKEVDRILEDNIYSIRFGTIKELPTLNGLVDAVTIKEERSSFFGHLAGIWARELVKFKQGYPKKGKATVEMSTDVILMRRKEFIKLKKEYLKLSRNE